MKATVLSVTGLMCSVVLTLLAGCDRAVRRVPPGLAMAGVR